AGKPDVEQYQLIILKPQLGQARFTAFDRLHQVAFILEHTAEGLPDTGLVVDYQNPHTLHERATGDGISGDGISDVGFRISDGSGLGSSGSTITGIATVKRAPDGRLSSTRIVPLWSATILFTMARPSPVPRPFLGKKGRERHSLFSSLSPPPPPPPI